jgi:hypothetical protein
MAKCDKCHECRDCGVRDCVVGTVSNVAFRLFNEAKPGQILLLLTDSLGFQKMTPPR